MNQKQTPSPNIFTNLANPFRKKSRPHSSISSSNSSIDAYKQLAIRHIRNYVDSEDEDFSNRTRIKARMYKEKNELDLIDESRCTYASSVNMSVILKSNKKIGSFARSRKKVIRPAYSLNKIDINYN